MKHILLVFLLAFTSVAYTQQYFYLEDVKLKKKEDFKENEGNVLKAISYLTSTPIDESNFDRKACIRFIIRYAEKTPFVSISVGDPISKIADNNTELLIMYMGLYMKAAFANEEGTQQQLDVEVYTAIYRYVKAGNNIMSNAAIKKLIVAGDNNQIEEYVKANSTVQKK
ncbi:MAG: hypothetical protein RLZZ367_1466 [Bacteroidota bacterium]|jgi:hypothetical protein